MRNTIPMLTGAGTAIVTPFTSAGEIDEAALRRFVAWQVEEGINYIVPCGSTGEAATMTSEFVGQLISTTVQISKFA